MKIKAKLRPDVPATEPRTRRRKPPVSRAARMLALAYHIERLVDSGELRDYAAAAELMGVTRARMSQIMNLLNLPVGVKEDILAGRLDASERGLRKALSRSDSPV